VTDVQFSFDNVRTTEFGVGRDEAGNRVFSSITVDADVQDALQEMASDTWEAMRLNAAQPARYEPSEKHAATEHLKLPLADELAEQLCDLHNAQNLPLDNNALGDPSVVFCYFARMTDARGRRLTALRRATQFKGIVKSRLIRFVTDALKLVEDNVFKLDKDFDLLVDATTIHIFRPSGFEFVCQLQQAVLDAVPQTVEAIAAELTTVDFSTVAEYAGKHPRAARYLASIRTQPLDDIDTRALKRLCKQTGVQFQTINGKITVENGHVMGLLEVLDRRRYEVKLVKDAPERFRASSRSRLEG